MKKTNQQSRSGWGGRRKGAGAPPGNANAVKHGERSRRAGLALSYGGKLPQLVALRAGSLVLAERYGELTRSDFSDPAAWRAIMLIDGIMWQRTRKMMSIELKQARAAIKRARLIPLRRTRKSAQ